MNGDPRSPRDGEGPRWFGLYPAVVSDLVDPCLLYTSRCV